MYGCQADLTGQPIRSLHEVWAAHLWSIRRRAQVLPNDICDLLNNRFRNLHTSRQTGQDQRESQEVVLDFETSDRVDSCPMKSQLSLRHFIFKHNSLPHVVDIGDTSAKQASNHLFALIRNYTRYLPPEQTFQ